MVIRWYYKLDISLFKKKQEISVLFKTKERESEYQWSTEAKYITALKKKKQTPPHQIFEVTKGIKNKFSYIYICNSYIEMFQIKQSVLKHLYGVTYSWYKKTY